ncbi:hypothetical protein ABMA27_006979 [Loxostege sticticalis]|uniref:Seroin transcript 1A n=2 Tax=Loxostege sticticalis TaxID=481309 RepID=A0ABR3IL58_LOXSC
MTKIIILLVVAAVAVSCIHADENFPNFPQFPMFPFNNFPGLQQPFALLNPDYVKDMKPGPGGHVAGAFVSSSSSSETVDGVTKKKSSGRVVTNQDGKVQDVSF